MSDLVSHKMLEALRIVSDLPMGYRRIRKDVILDYYESILKPSPTAWDAFCIMMETIKEEEASESGLACYQHFKELSSRK